MNFYTTKDIAAALEFHPRTVKRWWKALGEPPDFVAKSGCHRWTIEGYARLRAKIEARWGRKGMTPREAAALYSGNGKPNGRPVKVGGWSRPSKRGQLKLRLKF